jgi:hypothetical protein
MSRRKIEPKNDFVGGNVKTRLLVGDKVIKVRFTDIGKYGLSGYSKEYLK